MKSLFSKYRKFFTFLIILITLGYPLLIALKDIIIIDKNSKIIKLLEPLKFSPKKIEEKTEIIIEEDLSCLLKENVIKSAWHCIDKEIFPADEYLYDYFSEDVDKFKLPGGYIELFNGKKIIGTNGKGEMFIYDPVSKFIRSHKSNLVEIYEAQNFKVFRSSLWGRFGVKDIFLDEDTNEIYASLTVDITDGRGCYGMAIYKADFIYDEKNDFLTDLNFKEFFKTKKCYEGFSGHAGGGRINKLNDDIIFTVGTLDFDEKIIKTDEYLPEKLSNALGKIISINKNGEYKVLSRGHRNQQGLTIFKEKIFITEHGPKGGDEINIIENNNHYGWPYYSYGSDYDDTLKFRFPHSKEYEKPKYYFTPSIAIGEIIFYDGDEFPNWKNKFLVTSLKYKSLFLMDYNFKDNTFISSERIEIGNRIRDIELTSNGEIIIITDDQKIIHLSRSKNDFLKKTNQWDLPS